MSNELIINVLIMYEVDKNSGSKVLNIIVCSLGVAGLLLFFLFDKEIWGLSLLVVAVVVLLVEIFIALRQLE